MGNIRYRVIPLCDVRRTKGATYRGVKLDSQRTCTYGEGLYSTTNRAMAKEYGNVIGIVGGMPERPLVIKPYTAFADWLRKESGCKSMREFEKKHPDTAKFVMSRGYDGVIDGEIIVKYSEDYTEER